MMCGQALISQAAHIQKGGMGIKGCDSSVRPLCCDTPSRQGCHAKIDQNKIKLPWELRQDIIDAPVYYHWQEKNYQEAMHQIFKFRGMLNEILRTERNSKAGSHGSD